MKLPIQTTIYAYRLSSPVCQKIMPAIPASNGEIRFTLHEIRNTSIQNQVSSIESFMQNEPKFRKVKYNVTKVSTKDYDLMDTWSIRKNEPKTNPNEPKTNPIKANKMPKQTQFKPNLSCRSLWRSRNKPNFKANI